MPEPAGPFVVALETDLIFATRIEDVARACGSRAEIVTSAEELWQAIGRWPVLVMIDLAVGTDWQPVVRRAKNLPHTRPIPILAFGSHVDAEALRAARAAGCDHAWARSRFMAELPELVARALQPATVELAACAAPPPPLLLKGIEQFNRGEYWECHETLEELWRSEPGQVRDLYQGILQVGVAFHHLRAGNYAGALKLFRRGLPRFRGLPSVCQGVPVADFAAAARAAHDQMVLLGPARVAEFDPSSLPRIQLASAEA